MQKEKKPTTPTTPAKPDDEPLVIPVPITPALAAAWALPAGEEADKALAEALADDTFGGLDVFVSLILPTTPAARSSITTTILNIANGWR
jgi:hypothetical protein